MKNKVVTYALIFFVVVIWGTIAYRIWAAVHEDNSDLPVAAAATKPVEHDFTEVKDTAKLSLHYRDPFSVPGHVDTTAKPERAVRPSPLAQVMVPKYDAGWSQVKYSGFIRNPDSKKLIAIMNINGRSTMLAEGETSGGVKILKNLKDSVKVSFKNQTKFITLSTAL